MTSPDPGPGPVNPGPTFTAAGDIHNHFYGADGAVGAGPAGPTPPPPADGDATPSSGGDGGKPSDGAGKPSGGPAPDPAASAGNGGDGSKPSASEARPTAGTAPDPAAASGNGAAGNGGDGAARRVGAPNMRDKLGMPGGNWAKAGDGPVAGLRRAQWDAGQHGARWAGEKLASKLPTAAGKLVGAGAKALPLIGTIAALTAAYHNFKDGDYFGTALNVIAAVPGPIGWAGMGASFVWEIFHDESGPCGVWDAPDGINTFMLPAAAKDVGGVLAVDAALTTAQKEVFGFADGPSGTVWNQRPPDPLRLDTPEVKNELNSWLKGIADQFALIEQALAESNEPYMQQALQRLKPQLAAMKKLPDHAKAIEAQLDAASDAAGTWYAAVLHANKAARTQIAQNQTLNDAGPARAFDDAKATAVKAISNAATKLAAVGDAPLAVAAAPRRSLTARHEPAAAAPRVDAMPPMPQLSAPEPAPAPVAPTPAPTAPTTPAPATPAKSSVADDLGKLIAAMHPPAMPMGGMGNPLGGMGMPMGGMPMGGTPLGGGGTPLGQPKPATPLAEPVKRELATERPKLSTEPVDNKVAKPADAKPAAAEAKAPAGEKKSDTPAAMGAVPAAPAAAPAPSGEKPAAPTVKPAATKPTDTSVDVKGTKVSFPDAKTAAMAKELATGGPNHPVSLADAATKAGLVPPVPGQDPGQQVSPHDAKPGDLLRAGDRDYMLMGDGKFLDFQAGKVVDADQMPHDLGANGGYFHLRDNATAGTVDLSAPGPVSGPAPAVTTTTVADGPTVPADSAPAVPATGTTSTGTPGVPEKGPAGAGPVNAAATDTGRGQGAAPVVGSKPLDPTSIA